jgi:hypothetical protein
MFKVQTKIQGWGFTRILFVGSVFGLFTGSALYFAYCRGSNCDFLSQFFSFMVIQVILSRAPLSGLRVTNKNERIRGLGCCLYLLLVPPACPSFWVTSFTCCGAFKKIEYKPVLFLSMVLVFLLECVHIFPTKVLNPHPSS